MHGSCPAHTKGEVWEPVGMTDLRGAAVSRLTRFLVAVVLPVGAACAGCAVSEPDDTAWVDAARQTLEDSVASAATTRLALQERSAGHLSSSYAVVVARDAEELAGTTADTLTTQQPPPGRSATYDRLGGLLEDLTSAVASGRVALVDDDPAEIQQATKELTSVLADLRRTLEELS